MIVPPKQILFREPVRVPPGFPSHRITPSYHAERAMARAAALAIHSCLAVLKDEETPPRISLVDMWVELKKSYQTLADLPKDHAAPEPSAITYKNTANEALARLQQGPAPSFLRPATFYLENAPTDDFTGVLIATVLFLSEANAIPHIVPDVLRAELDSHPRKLKAMGPDMAPPVDLQGIAYVLRAVLFPTHGLAYPLGSDKNVDRAHHGLLLHTPQDPEKGSREPYPLPEDTVVLPFNARVPAHAPHEEGEEASSDTEEEREEEEEEEEAVSFPPEIPTFHEGVLQELDDEWNEF